jgi:hypothetical protein
MSDSDPIRVEALKYNPCRWFAVAVGQIHWVCALPFAVVAECLNFAICYSLCFIRYKTCGFPENGGQHKYTAQSELKMPQITNVMFV